MTTHEAAAPEQARSSRWLVILLIAWNVLDIAVHVALGMVEPWRVAGNAIGIAAAVVLLFGAARRYAPQVLVGAAGLVVVVNVIHSALNGWVGPSFVFIGVSLVLLAVWAQDAARRTGNGEGGNTPLHLRRWMAIVATIAALTLIGLSGEQEDVTIALWAPLHNGELVAADIWSEEPMILSAGMGFDNIIGLPGITEESVRDAGGSWHGSVQCTNGDDPHQGALTSAVTTQQVGALFKGESEYDDGLPIVFSWPVATETVDLTDFQFTLNTGDIVFPNSIGMAPNWELNERNTVVAFGDFGNRGLSSEDDAVFPVRLHIVEDDTPLLLIGPGGQEFNGVGLSWETDTSPYDSGPALVGAKLNHVGDEPLGEGGLRRGEDIAGLPNDEFALYDEGDFRLRVLTTGGFSPDGVTGLRPDMYEEFFRLHATGPDGETVLIEEVGVDYDVAGGTLRVIGLSDLGPKEDPENGVFYDDCYTEDRDNYVDIILVGDEAAARNITFVEIPSIEGGYQAFFNPGGPGPEPFDGVRYTAPGPPDLEPVLIALDEPMRVNREAP
jgi:hypothetical protein